MTHGFFSHRSIDAEARLVRFAGPGEAPAVPAAPEPVEAPPPAEGAAVDVADARMAYQQAQMRIDLLGKKLAPLQKTLADLTSVQIRHETGDAPKDEVHADLGVVDDEGDGFKDDVDAKIAETEAAMKPHQEALAAANQQIEQQLAAIEASGEGGKIQAAMMRVESVFKNPNASLGEKIATIFTAFAQLKNLFNSFGSPQPSETATSEAAPAAAIPEAAPVGTPEAAIAKLGDDPLFKNSTMHLSFEGDGDDRRYTIQIEASPGKKLGEQKAVILTNNGFSVSADGRTAILKKVPPDTVLRLPENLIALNKRMDEVKIDYVARNMNDGAWHDGAEGVPNAIKGWEYRYDRVANLVYTRKEGDDRTLQVYKDGMWKPA